MASLLDQFKSAVDMLNGGSMGVTTSNGQSFQVAPQMQQTAPLMQPQVAPLAPFQQPLQQQFVPPLTQLAPLQQQLAQPQVASLQQQGTATSSGSKKWPLIIGVVVLVVVGGIVVAMMLKKKKKKDSYDNLDDEDDLPPTSFGRGNNTGHQMEPTTLARREGRNQQIPVQHPQQQHRPMQPLHQPQPLFVEQKERNYADARYNNPQSLRDGSSQNYNRGAETSMQGSGQIPIATLPPLTQQQQPMPMPQPQPQQLAPQDPNFTKL